MGEFLFPRRKRNQNAAGGGLRWASPPIVAPPGPRLQGIPLRPSEEVPARKMRLQVLIPSGPLGPGAAQNFGLHHFTAAPGSDQPWQRVWDRRCVGRSRSHESGTGGSGIHPCGEPLAFPRHGGRGKPLPYGWKGKHSATEDRRAATRGRPYGISGRTQLNRTASLRRFKRISAKTHKNHCNFSRYFTAIFHKNPAM